MDIRNYALQVRAGDKSTTGTLRLRVWRPEDKVRRGLKSMGLFLGLSVLSVFIPLAHFFLVPFFLLAAPVVGYVVYKQLHKMIGATYTCPACAHEGSLPAMAMKFPMRISCQKCREFLEIERV